MSAPQPVPENYSQPNYPLIKEVNKGWLFNGLDFQVTTKSEDWNQNRTKRLAEYQAGKDLGINYAGIAVPYDNYSKMADYVADARSKGLKVYFRSHWNAWEGDNSISANMTAQQYLDQTYDFIVAHPELYEDGDKFTVCVECNNTNDNGNIAYPFRVGNVVGGAFDMTAYNRFLRDQVTYANLAFSTIGKQVYTNFLSMSLALVGTFAPALDSGTNGRSGGFTPAEIKQYFGVLSIDHYMNSDYRSGDNYGQKLSADLDKLYNWFRVPISIDEWGYPTTEDLSDGEQREVYSQVVDVFRSKTYIIGVNFWTHMASNTASIFEDSGGTIIASGRACVSEIKKAFKNPNQAFLTPTKTSVTSNTFVRTL